jgi:uncharacterized membrane protein
VATRGECTEIRSTLLTLHLLAVVVWLGAGLYDLLLLREIRRSAGDAVELALIRLRLRYGPVIAVATVVVLFTGVLMSSLLGWGYFTHLWLGLKQVLMGLVVALLIPFIPVVIRLQRAVDGLATRVPATDEVRRLLARGVRYEIAMRVAAVLALLLAVYKPG